MKRYFSLLQSVQTDPGANPASKFEGWVTGVLFPRVKCAARDVAHYCHLAARLRMSVVVPVFPSEGTDTR
jgi:hypothetical protein